VLAEAYRGLIFRTDNCVWSSSIGNVAANELAASGKIMLKGISGEANAPHRVLCRSKLPRATPSSPKRCAHQIISFIDNSGHYFRNGAHEISVEPCSGQLSFRLGVLLAPETQTERSRGF
jgi:hypothetical protein